MNAGQEQIHQKHMMPGCVDIVLQLLQGQR